MSKYFKRISSNEAREIARQVTAGILNETEAVLEETEKLIRANVQSDKQRKALYAQIEKNLESSGISAKFESK